MKFVRSRVIAVMKIVPAALLLSGCAAPVLGALTLNHIMTMASVVTTAASGKGVGDLALDAATGQDCRMLESTFRTDRELCEDTDSPATRRDFKGLSSVAAFMERRSINDNTRHRDRQLAFDIELASGE